MTQSLADTLSEQAISHVLGAIPAEVALPCMARIIARMLAERRGHDHVAAVYGGISRDHHLLERRQGASRTKGRR